MSTHDLAAAEAGLGAAKKKNPSKTLTEEAADLRAQFEAAVQRDDVPERHRISKLLAENEALQGHDIDAKARIAEKEKAARRAQQIEAARAEIESRIAGSDDLPKLAERVDEFLAAAGAAFSELMEKTDQHRRAILNAIHCIGGSDSASFRQAGDTDFNLPHIMNARIRASNMFHNAELLFCGANTSEDFRLPEPLRRKLDALARIAREVQPK